MGTPYRTAISVLGAELQNCKLRAYNFFQTYEVLENFFKIIEALNKIFASNIH